MEYTHILGATDFSELGNSAVRKAALLAVEGNCKLTVMTVLPQPEMPSPLLSHYDVTTDEGRLSNAKQAALDALSKLVPDSVREAGVDIDYVVRVGDPATEILAADIRIDPDLIVLATHGRRGWRRWIMGSVSERVVQMATADVLSVRERGDHTGHEEEE